MTREVSHRHRRFCGCKLVLRGCVCVCVNVHVEADMLDPASARRAVDVGFKSLGAAELFVCGSPAFSGCHSYRPVLGALRHFHRRAALC